MTLEKSRKLLRYAGIFAIFGGLIAMILGILMTSGRIHQSGGMLQMAEPGVTLADSQNKTDGLLSTFSGAFGLAEGVCSFLTSGKTRFANAARGFSFLSFAANLGSCGIKIIEEGFTLLNTINLLIALALFMVIFASANRVRKAHKETA